MKMLEYAGFICDKKSICIYRTLYIYELLQPSLSYETNLAELGIREIEAQSVAGLHAGRTTNHCKETVMTQLGWC